MIQEMTKIALSLLHWGSCIYDFHKKMINSVSPPYPQISTIDLLFKNDRIRKHVANNKAPLFHFHVDVINVWFLAPQAFKINHLTDLNIALRFQERKIKFFNVWKFPLIPRICSTRRISGIVEKLRKLRIINRQKAGLLFHRIETNFSICKICKTEPVLLFTTEVVWYRNRFLLLFIYLFFIYRWQKTFYIASD